MSTKQLNWRQDGIRTIEGLKDRCKVDPITGCWHWAGARRSGSKVPKMLIPGYGVGGLSRALSILIDGAPREMGGKLWKAQCGTEHCCNPQHQVQVTLSKAHRMSRPKLDAAHRAKITASSRASRGKYTPELKARILQDPAPASTLAAQIGLSHTLICKVRAGKAWTDATRGASVFAWAGGSL
jgi:hypothetical protein